MKVTLNINGKNHEIEIKPHDYILDVLRKIGCHSVRRGCETSSCSVCTILIDGKPVHSCSTFAARCEGHEIVTVDGIGDEGIRLAKIIVECGVDQCGYCSPGFILTVMGMKNELKEPTDDEIKHYLVNNLCRCTGYEGQLRAIKRFLREVN